MKATLSYSDIFNDLNETIQYLISINYSHEKIDSLKLAQNIVLSFELMNLSLKQSVDSLKS